MPHLLCHTLESRADCRGMVRRLEYISEGRAVGLLLCLNTWNYFQVTASGELEAFTVHMECQREETRHGDKLVQNEVVLLELRVMVRDEHFLINPGIVESRTEHLQLPCTRAVRRPAKPTFGKTQLATAAFTVAG
ncbi:MAG: hypothetical protein GY696_26685 [Gammaproteobacteria bacterium]|nr:hypothetical protein [Gammaproteobacteria bacterium]